MVLSKEKRIELYRVSGIQKFIIENGFAALVRHFIFCSMLFNFLFQFYFFKLKILFFPSLREEGEEMHSLTSQKHSILYRVSHLAECFVVHVYQ